MQLRILKKKETLLEFYEIERNENIGKKDFNEKTGIDVRQCCGICSDEAHNMRKNNKKKCIEIYCLPQMFTL